MSGSITARRVVATPTRSVSETWMTIIKMIAPQEDSEARKELEAVAGTASALIADEALKDAAAIIYGNGPRIRIYCLYDDEAISGDNKNENTLAAIPTEGDWKMSLPCPEEDLEWVQAALTRKSSRITARDLSQSLQQDDGDDEGGETK